MHTTVSRLLLIVVALLSVTGCGYHASSNAGVTTIHFDTASLLQWTLGTFAFGVASTVIAVYLPRFRLHGVIFATGAFLFFACVVPGIWQDSVTLDAQGVTQRTGFWWSSTIKGFRFADTAEVRIVHKPTGSDNDVNEVWEIQSHDGRTHDIDPGDLWENAADAVATEVRHHGVRVIDRR